MSLENMNTYSKWCLFRGIVCDLLDKHGYIRDKWAFTECLDMSFESLCDLPVDDWSERIESDLIEYKMKEGYELFDK